MLFYATKVVSGFLFPLGLSVILLIILAVIGRRRKAVLVLSVAVLVLLLVCGTPMVSRVISATLEDQYPPVPIERLPDAQVIVVLGGTLRPPAAQGEHAELTAVACLMMLERVNYLMSAVEVHLPKEEMIDRITAIMYAAFRS